MNFKLVRSAALMSFAMTLTCTMAEASNTDVMLNLEGNPTCSSLGENSAILEARVGSPQASGTINGTTSGGVTQTIAYSIDDSGSLPLLSWDITSPALDDSELNPVNYVVIKAKGNRAARVFHYGGIGRGFTSDIEMEARGDITAISFCYGLTTGPVDNGGGGDTSLLDMSKIPNCEDLAETDPGVNDLFTTGIICPDSNNGGEAQLIVNLALDKPNFGFNFEAGEPEEQAIRACTCNTTLPPCNPDLPLQKVNDLGYYLDGNDQIIYDENNQPVTAESDSLTGEERSCLEYGPVQANGLPAGINEAVPFAFEGVENPDSYVCYIIGGRRYCYGHY